jgi:hypothetical protein
MAYGPHFWKATYFGLIFMLMYIPNDITQNLISDQQNENGYGNLGFISMGLLYLSQMAMSIYAAAITAKIGITWSTVIGSFFLSTVVFGCALSTWSA